MVISVPPFSEAPSPAPLQWQRGLPDIEEVNSNDLAILTLAKLIELLLIHGREKDPPNGRLSGLGVHGGTSFRRWM
ncbi:hypothetical protein NHF46_13590 [Arthrobacter alpinus]|nr:hypothetical protein [Arthrobacter alpinus]